MGEDAHSKRSLNGPSLTIFYSNMGVLQTTVAEIVTVKEHQRKCSPKAEVTFILILTRSRLFYHALYLVPRVCLA